MVDMIELAHAVCGIAPETPQVSLADEIRRNVTLQLRSARKVEWAREDGDDDRSRKAHCEAGELARAFGALLERVRELEEGRR